MTLHITNARTAVSCLVVLLALFGTGAAALSQQDAETRFADAQSLFSGGDAQGALSLLDGIIADTPRARYPSSPWRAAAAVRAGEIELALGRVEQATARFVDVVEQEAPTMWTSRARFGLATALLWGRDWQAAAPLLQQVVDAFNGDGAAADPLSGTLAAQRLTLLHRVWLRVAAGGQPWVSTGRLDIGTPLDRPIGVAAGVGGLLITDEGRDSLVFVDSGGNAATFTLRDPQRPWWSDNGEAYVAARATVEAPLSATSLQFVWNDDGRAREVEDIRAGLRTPAGGWVLLDDDSHRVLQFTPERAFERALDTRGGEPVDVARGPRGRLFVIEKDRREVMIFGADGTLQGGFAVDGWGEPYALAIDAIGHVYVLDRDNKRIDVFDPDGGILWTLGPVLPGGVELDDPRDVAVDGAGRVLVADRDLRVLVVIE